MKVGAWHQTAEELPEESRVILGLFSRGGLAIVTFYNGRFVQSYTQAQIYMSTPLGEIAGVPQEWAYLSDLIGGGV
ncbi:hypothetical protein ABC502_14380 [Alkalimonas sp. NCh-2]|uniref:hypothetical protein n=1 Tax=Alkalimonas sp. NCh-2 TaxID=3144846 RepID=UPI0031F6BABB